MDNNGKFDSFRRTFGEAITGLMFTIVVVLVVGGTTAMCLERSAIYA
jgi:hypothetical protein